MRPKLLIVLIFLAGMPLVGAIVPAHAADAPTIGPAPERPKPPADYRCPPTTYIDCMPQITDDRRAACSKDYIAWVQTHCPGVQVVY